MGGDLQVTCPACRTGGHVPLSFSGKDIHCKKCGKSFRVSASSVSAPSAAAAPVAAPSVSDSLSDDTDFAPLSEEEVSHCRERYEARVLSKNRNEHHDHHDHAHHDRGNGHHNQTPKPASTHDQETTRQPAPPRGPDTKHGG